MSLPYAARQRYAYCFVNVLTYLETGGVDVRQVHASCLACLPPLTMYDDLDSGISYRYYDDICMVCRKDIYQPISVLVGRYTNGTT